MASNEEVPSDVRDIARERAAVKGVEGVIARRYPELYNNLKKFAEETGQDVLDVIATFAQWAYEVKKYSPIITKEDLKNITPESLYAALKFVKFYMEEFYRAQSYANVAAVQAIYQIVEAIISGRLAQMRQEETGFRLIAPAPPSPSTIESLARTVLRAIELFTLGRPEVQEELATKVASKIMELATKGSSASSGQQQ